MWEVLRFVPAANYFRLQLVSRQWRQKLTSRNFYSRVVQPPVVACLTRTGACGDHSASGSEVEKKGSDVEKKVVVDIDLSLFVPNWFWNSDGDSVPYCVVAAADGLVCISNNTEDNFGCCPKSRWIPGRGCSPPAPPSPSMATCWAPAPTRGTTTRCKWPRTTSPPAVAAGGSWRRCANRTDFGSAGSPPWRCARAKRTRFPCGVTGCRPGEGPAVKVAQLEEPPLEMLGVDPGRQGLCRSLVAHRGAVYFLEVPDDIWSDELDVVLMGVWRLARERLEWELVARLLVGDVVRLTGLKRSDVVGNYVALRGASCSGVRESLYCTVKVGLWRLVVAINLDTGEWELVHHGQGQLLELRPDVFV